MMDISSFQIPVPDTVTYVTLFYKYLNVLVTSYMYSIEGAWQYEGVFVMTILFRSPRMYPGKVKPVQHVHVYT